MNTAVKVGKPILHPCFILAPRHAVHPGSRILLQGFVTLPQQIQRHMVQQSSEPLFLPFLRRSAHTTQSGVPVELERKFTLSRNPPIFN
jgi:hypothetical protein